MSGQLGSMRRSQQRGQMEGQQRCSILGNFLADYLQMHDFMGQMYDDGDRRILGELFAT